MKLGNLSSYEIFNLQVFFPYLFKLLKSWVIPQLWFVIVLKCNSYEFSSHEMLIFYPLVDISICLTILLGFLLKTFRKVYSHFVYFFILRHEFIVDFLWESKKFYWIIWGPYNRDPMWITLITFCQLFWYSENLTFKLLILNRFVHSINIAVTLYMMRRNVDFAFMIHKTWKTH